MESLDVLNSLTKSQHAKFFKRCLCQIPSSLASFDSIRATMCFFCISGLELLNCLEEYDKESRRAVIEWLYQLQICPKGGEGEEDAEDTKWGFEGTDSMHFLDSEGSSSCSPAYEMSHLAMTYTALASLLTLGDDLSRVNRAAIIRGMRGLQREDGSFTASKFGSENDMRFVYCAAAVSYMLKDWSGMDLEAASRFIRRSMSYDFGFGQRPELESHGGVTYCAIASLVLMDRLHHVLTPTELEGLRRWAIMRQKSGFQGRVNKPEDTCYSFWVGATLKMLNIFDKVNFTENRDFILSTQHPLTGGFSKWVGSPPDPLHTYLGLAGLSLMSEPGLQDMHPALNLSKRTVDHLHKIQESW